MLFASFPARILNVKMYSTDFSANFEKILDSTAKPQSITTKLNGISSNGLNAVLINQSVTRKLLTHSGCFVWRIALMNWNCGESSLSVDNNFHSSAPGLGLCVHAPCRSVGIHLIVCWTVLYQPIHKSFYHSVAPTATRPKTKPAQVPNSIGVLSERLIDLGNSWGNLCFPIVFRRFSAFKWLMR